MPRSICRHSLIQQYSHSLSVCSPKFIFNPSREQQWDLVYSIHLSPIREGNVQWNLWVSEWYWTLQKVRDWFKCLGFLWLSQNGHMTSSHVFKGKLYIQKLTAVHLKLTVLIYVTVESGFLRWRFFLHRISRISAIRGNFTLMLLMEPHVS